MVRVLCNQASITFIKNFHDFALRIVVDHVDFFIAPPPPPSKKKKNTKKRNIPFPKIIANALGAISHCIVKSFRSIDNH